MNRKILTALFALTILLMLSSCTTTSSFHYGNILPAERTLTLNPGGDNFLGNLKQALLTDGWELYLNGADHLVTDIAPNQELQYRKYSSRYLLRTSYRLSTNFSEDDSLINYDLSMIDLESGKEVVTYSGAGNIFILFPVKRVIKGFVEELRKVTSN